MKNLDDKILSDGYNIMSNSSVSICSIVRDCDQSLKRNIYVIEAIRKSFFKSNVIIFENDSKDNTKNVLSSWRDEYKDVYVSMTDFNERTIPENDKLGVNKYYSKHRISRLAKYRNQYLDRLDKMYDQFLSDFVIIVDLDVASIDISGIAHSFGLSEQWDAVCSNGYFYDSLFNRKYYDAYALLEHGTENNKQTEESIQNCRIKWGKLKLGMPLIPVYSGFGGLAIYRYDAIKGQRYKVINNNDPRVEVMCEHFSLCRSMRDFGKNRIFINPNMAISYFRFDLKLIKKAVQTFKNN